MSKHLFAMFLLLVVTACTSSQSGMMVKGMACCEQCPCCKENCSACCKDGCKDCCKEGGACSCCEDGGCAMCQGKMRSDNPMMKGSPATGAACKKPVASGMRGAMHHDGMKH